MAKAKPTTASMLRQQERRVLQLVEESLISRQALIQKLMDPRRDYDVEAGYPTTITLALYRQTYNRLGLGHRVVEVLPQESWAMAPVIYDDEDANNTTPFEAVWNTLQKELNVLHYLARIDILSGIGRYGVLLLGFDDGLGFEQPVAGVPDDELLGPEAGEVVDTEPTRKLLYIRAFDETVAVIDKWETDPKSPRFGRPLMYSIDFKTEEGTASSSWQTVARTLKVHWTRVLHVADNRDTSEVLGTPRQQVIFDRLVDSKKIMAGSGEMFWKGGFPGVALETLPGVEAVDADAVRETMQNYQNRLQRYIAVAGVSVKSLSPAIADPTSHYGVLVRDICITLGIPQRIFMGSEEAKLASSQDTKTWNKRIARRREEYVTPMLVRPFVTRMIAAGVVPAPENPEGYTVWWPDLNAPSDAEKAAVALQRTQALQAYVAGGVDQIVPPMEYLTLILGLEQAEAEQVMEAAEAYQAALGQNPEDALPAQPGATGSTTGPNGTTPDDALLPDESATPVGEDS